jgi:hypothetical protein
MSNPEIRFLNNSDIDRDRWDQCILSSTHSSVYSSCWFLDLVCPGWKGLICGDYEYIMPLPFHQKFGISYLSQPVYAQQFGIFPEPGQEILSEMLNWVIGHFKYIRLSLIPLNIPSKLGFTSEARKNFVLSLNFPYHEIATLYPQNTRRNIRKAKQSVFILKTIGSEEYLNLKRSFPGVEDDPRFQKTIAQIITKALKHQKGIIYGAYSSENKLCAAAFFLFDSKRVYYLNAVSSETGKALSAMYAIVDQFIQDHSEQNLLLDFEGSLHPGIARFYEGFGSECELYQHIYRNTLPWPLRIIKK